MGPRGPLEIWLGVFPCVSPASDCWGRDRRFPCLVDGPDVFGRGDPIPPFPFWVHRDRDLRRILLGLRFDFPMSWGEGEGFGDGIPNLDQNWFSLFCLYHRDFFSGPGNGAFPGEKDLGARRLILCRNRRHRLGR